MVYDEGRHKNWKGEVYCGHCGRPLEKQEVGKDFDQYVGVQRKVAYMECPDWREYYRGSFSTFNPHSRLFIGERGLMKAEKLSDQFLDQLDRMANHPAGWWLLFTVGLFLAGGGFYLFFKGIN